MADPHAPSAEEIRALVRRIVDQTVAPVPALATTGSSPARDGKTMVAIAGDHGGWRMKDAIGAWLTEHGYGVRDCGTHSDDAVDYPDLALAVAQLVADGSATWGIVVDGAGIGSAMAANKVPGVRAANCHDLSSARNSREHNYANVLTLGAGFLGTALALQVVETWLATDWGAERHGRRVDKISAIERSYTGASGGRDR
jgi:RpiB/LacA/LacB family sugar-phosphate isomerase